MPSSSSVPQIEPSQKSGFVDPYLGISLVEAVGLFLLLMSVHLMSNYNYLLFHSAAELFSIFIAITLGIIVINCWRSIKNQYILFIGLGYFFVGFLDVLHTLTYKGMPIFTDYDYYAPQFWIAARYLEAITMLLGFTFLGTKRQVNGTLAVGGLSIATAGLVSSILYFKNFPVCFVPGQGLTPFKVISEYIICSLMLVNLGLLYWRRAHFDLKIYRLISWSVVLMIAMELCFTLYVTDTMSDAFNQAGHLLKIGTFYLIYKAVVVTALRDPLNLLFRELHQKETELESRIIERTNMLAESESRFRTMADSAPVLIWISGLNKKGFWFNKVWLDFTGRTMQQEVGDGWAAGVHPDDVHSCLATYQSAFDAKRKFELEYRLRRFDGAYRWLSVAGVPRFDQRELFSGYIGSCIDITDRKTVEEALKVMNMDFVTLLESSSDFLYFKDRDSRIRYCSQTMADITGHKSWRDMVGKHDLEIFPTETADIYVKEEEPIFAQGVPLLNKIDPYIKADGSRGWVSTNKWPMFAEDGKSVIGLVGISRDVTESRHQEDELRLMATTDFLTGVESRRTFVDAVDYEIARMQRDPSYLCAIMMFDLDHFKRVNDTYGHPTGDAVLKHITKLMTSEMRKVDRMGRLGGEEFALLMPGADVASATNFAERVRQKVESTMVSVDGVSIGVTVSIGLSTLKRTDESSKPVLDRVDQALYKAKNNGRNRVENSF